MGGDAGLSSVRPRPGQHLLVHSATEAGAGRAAGAATSPSADSAEATLRRRFAGARILLAEDNPVNLEVALELLQAVALAVDAAADGVEAARRSSRVRALRADPDGHADAADERRGRRAVDPHAAER
ncbi:MAG: hypothetical protein MZW92_75245 [Comamonadaceae bacterium]|nr:hypothetical protein [Comamonadaceae bacterium]